MATRFICRHLVEERKMPLVPRSAQIKGACHISSCLVIFSCRAQKVRAPSQYRIPLPFLFRVLEDIIRQPFASWGGSGQHTVSLTSAAVAGFGDKRLPIADFS